MSILGLVAMTASSLSAVTAMFGTHNLIAFGDVSLSKEFYGPAYIEGSLTLTQSMQFGGGPYQIPKTDAIMSVQNGIYAGSNWINLNEGSIVSRNIPTQSLSINRNSGGSLITGQAAWDHEREKLGLNPTDDLQDQFGDYAQSLANQATTATKNFSDPNQYSITGDGSETSYITIEATDLQKATGVNLNLNGSKTLVITVTGEGVYSFNFNSLGGVGKDVIWNFIGATSINFNGSRFQGSILAPNATVHTNGGSQGLVVVNNFTSNDELHENPITAPTIPEPQSAGPLLLSFGILILIRKRR